MKRIALILLSLAMVVFLAGCGGGEKPAAGKGEAKDGAEAGLHDPQSHTYNQGGRNSSNWSSSARTDASTSRSIPRDSSARANGNSWKRSSRVPLTPMWASTAPLSGFSPSMGILDLPFLFRDYAHVDKVLDGPVGRQLMDEIEKAGMKGLAFWENGFRNLTNSKRAVKAPADAKGLKIRTQENKIHLAAWKAVGVNPVPMAWGEVYGALQQKAIDGQENPIAVIHSVKLNEVQKYLTLSQHVYSPAMIIISLKKWQSFSKEDQDLLMKAALETAAYSGSWAVTMRRSRSPNWPPKACRDKGRGQDGLAESHEAGPGGVHSPIRQGPGGCHPAVEIADRVFLVCTGEAERVAHPGGGGRPSSGSWRSSPSSFPMRSSAATSWGEMPAWSGEAATFALVWVSMMGGAAGLRRGYRIGITVLYKKLTPGAARAVRVAADVLVLAFFLVMVVYGLQQTQVNIRQTSPAMGLSMAFPYAALPVGFALMFLFTLEETIRILRGAPGEG